MKPGKFTEDRHFADSLQLIFAKALCKSHDKFLCLSPSQGGEGHGMHCDVSVKEVWHPDCTAFPQLNVYSESKIIHAWQLFSI